MPCAGTSRRPGLGLPEVAALARSFLHREGPPPRCGPARVPGIVLPHTPGRTRVPQIIQPPGSLQDWRGWGEV